jgi:hypothetical protein
LVILRISHGAVSGVRVREKFSVIWKALVIRTVPECATLFAMKWFHTPTIIANGLPIVIIIIIIIIIM